MICYFHSRTIQQTINMILYGGQKYSQKNYCRSPLMYEWHDKQYFGAAHGIVGILFILLSAGDKYISSEQLDDLIRPSIDYLIKVMFESGNLPSSKGSERDRLVLVSIIM